MRRNKYLSTSISFGLAVALLAGCSAGKNYKRPELNAPAQYAAGASDSSAALLSWKVFFQDPTLVGLIDKALVSNFDLQLAIQRLEASHAYAKQARLAWLPSLNAQGTVSTNNPSNNSFTGIQLGSVPPPIGPLHHLEDYTLGGTLSWEIDVWGKIRRQKEAAVATYLQSFEARRAVQTGLVASVANNYYNLVMLDAQLEIATRNANLSDSIVQMIRLQKTAGEVTELAVQQALSQQQTAALLVPQLEQAITLQENALRLLLGDWPGTVTRGTALDSLLSQDSLATGVPADLLRLRPDVRSSELALVAANARVGAAQGAMYPALSITATGGLNAFEASNWFKTPASLFGILAGNLTQPIFQKRQLRTQLDVARVEREQRAIEFRRSVMQGVHEVTNALVKIEKLQTQQTVADDRVETLDQAVQNAQLLFRSGMANYLEVVTAQSRALQAELEQAAITRQHLSAQVELYQSLGGGWQ
ncbi:efflux transporter outer membrane subunit [Fulvivirgaceae bacterium PWU5]|uniref:Efflux transporter outer membrane subunit n=1 Tax=Dawidia cretensis TaxID=2782350 RepID=A0AAP2DZE9_9BACT|nr:efflux transporter outer membrane subunit [Dawidia cretensis]MBT1709254.1 efflux transporter outer membrane subunit [Dawidia cretensis]